MKPPKVNLLQSHISCVACSLNQICLPSGLSLGELGELDNTIDKTLKFKKKTLIFKASDPLDGIYAVKSGAVKTSISNEDGLEQILEFHMPGDILGFDAFDTNMHKCSATAIEDTLVCKINMEVFEDLCSRLPGVRKVMFHQVGKEITHIQKMLLSLGQQQADERFAVFLLKMATHYQARGFSHNEFILPMSRQDLSNYLGMAVETLSRIASRMTDDGVLQFNRRMVMILDRKKLEVLAHSSCGNT
jgi:CRP/FNR family transcriptional regulator